MISIPVSSLSGILTEIWADFRVLAVDSLLSATAPGSDRLLDFTDNYTAANINFKTFGGFLFGHFFPVNDHAGNIVCTLDTGESC